MTAMATLWQANDSFRPIGALFFEINGHFYYTLSILLKFRKIHKNLQPFISNHFCPKVSAGRFFLVVPGTMDNTFL